LVSLATLISNDYEIEIVSVSFVNEIENFVNENENVSAIVCVFFESESETAWTHQHTGWQRSHHRHRRGVDLPLVDLGIRRQAH
jgi:hypothetical protein